MVSAASTLSRCPSMLPGPSVAWIPLSATSSPLSGCLFLLMPFSKLGPLLEGVIQLPCLFCAQPPIGWKRVKRVPVGRADKRSLEFGTEVGGRQLFGHLQTHPLGFSPLYCCSTKEGGSRGVGKRGWSFGWAERLFSWSIPGQATGIPRCPRKQPVIWLKPTHPFHKGRKDF